MAELAVKTKRLDFHLEQVQDFTPTPMTVSTEAWYTGFHPYTLDPVFSAKTPKDKLAQRQFFFWYKPEERRNIERELRRIGRADLIPELYSNAPAAVPAKQRRDVTSPAHKVRKNGTNERNQRGGNSGQPKREKKKSYNPNFQNNKRK